MFRLGCGFYFLITGLFAILLLIVLGRVGKCKSLYLDMTNVDLAYITIDKGEGGFDGIGRYTKLTPPDVCSATRDETNNTVLSFGIHDAICNLFFFAVTPVSVAVFIAPFRTSAYYTHLSCP